MQKIADTQLSMSGSQDPALECKRNLSCEASGVGVGNQDPSGSRKVGERSQEDHPLRPLEREHAG